ncbi:MAG: YraN family protein [Actinocrinis sp.]
MQTATARTDTGGGGRGESGRAPTKPWGHWLGRYGEEAAARYLAGAGYQLLDRNWVCRDAGLRGELDLVARFRRTVVVCEVKTRSGDRLAHPAEAVTPDKAARLRLLAARWLDEHQRPGRAGAPGRAKSVLGRVNLLRIDVIAIRTSPRPPYTLRSLDHLVAVA